MIVKSLKKQFKENFNGTLRVYHGRKFADESSTLASIRSGDTKGGDFKVTGRMQAGSFEQKMKQEYGIRVQVADKADEKLVDNKLTLSKLG